MRWLCETDHSLSEWELECRSSATGSVTMQFHERMSSMTLDIIAGACFGGVRHGAMKLLLDRFVACVVQ